MLEPLFYRRIPSVLRAKAPPTHLHSHQFKAAEARHVGQLSEVMYLQVGKGGNREEGSIE